MSGSDSGLVSDLADAVLSLTIDREERRNALDAAVLEGLVTAIASPPAAARVIVVRSAGERVFCSGADLAVLGEGATEPARRSVPGGLHALILAMRDCPLPVIARVQGLCLAGGVGIAAGCDIVVASDAAQFGLPEVDRGLWPFLVSALLIRHVSPKVAMDLMLTGRRIGAEAARAAGLVSRVVPAADLNAEVDDLAAELAGKSPVAVRLGKAAFAAAAELTLAPGLAAMQAQLSLLTQTHDAAEGAAAFFAKRPPIWTGH